MERKRSLWKQLLQHFAEILEYPRSNVLSTAQACRELAAEVSPRAAVHLDAFVRFVAEVSPERLEELYSSTFDLDPTCHPYVGYHLLGESYKRSAFLVGLKERYRAHGFTVPAGELPDHLTILLRFLAVCDDPVLSSEIVHEALLPALARMTKERTQGQAPHTTDPAFPLLEGTGAPMPAMPEEAPVVRQARTENHPYLDVLRALRLTLEAFVPAEGDPPRVASLAISTG